MSIIARKIAVAAEADPARPEADDVASRLLPNTLLALSKWLKIEELVPRNISASWATADAFPLPDTIIAARGPEKTSCMAIAVSGAMARTSAFRLLSIEPSDDEGTLAALKPFLDENTLSLGEEASKVAWPGHEAVWTFQTVESVTKLFRETRTFRLELDCSETDAVQYHVTLLVSPDMLRAAPARDEEESEQEAANDRRLSPRLGPCHVEIQAVADKVRMSVADCSRLEIGQIVPLPRLRFDKLELNIEMGEGLVPLVDASLGADKGRKAVRLNHGIDPSFRQPLPDAQIRPDKTAVSV